MKDVSLNLNAALTGVKVRKGASPTSVSPRQSKLSNHCGLLERVLPRLPSALRYDWFYLIPMSSLIGRIHTLPWV